MARSVDPLHGVSGVFLHPFAKELMYKLFPKVYHIIEEYTNYGI